MANFHDYDWVMARLNEHYADASNLINEQFIFGVFYYGSANYGLDCASSDVDSKVIIIPSLEDISLNKKATSKVCKRDNGEQINFRDIRLWLQSLKQPNFVTLEILFSDYFIINPKFKDMWQRLKDYAEKIAKANPSSVLHAIHGMALDSFYHFTNPPAHIHDLDLITYRNKKLSHLLRYHDFLCKFLTDCDYAHCIKVDKPEVILSAKQATKITPATEEWAKRTMAAIDYLIEKYFSHQQEELPNKEIENFLDTIQIAIVKQSIQSEMGGERVC